MRPHSLRNVSCDTHGHCVARQRLRKLRDGVVSQIVQTQAGQSRFFCDFRHAVRQVLMGLVGRLHGMGSHMPVKCGASFRFDITLSTLLHSVWNMQAEDFMWFR
jgi:hypothetical protein